MPSRNVEGAKKSADSTAAWRRLGFYEQHRALDVYRRQIIFLEQVGSPEAQTDIRIIRAAMAVLEGMMTPPTKTERQDEGPF